MSTGGEPPTPTRHTGVDWLRGFAVLCMVLWHVVDAWHVPADRDTGAFAAVVFFAGWAAPVFLFLAGMSVALAGHARLARGLGRDVVVRGLMRRGWQVFLLAHLFRLQSFLLSPNSSWNGLLKPDILNVLGLGVVLTAFAWGHSVSPRARFAWLLFPAAVIAGVLTPWAADWWWPTLLHPRLEGYIRVVNGNAVFSLFPALAYVCAGAFAGDVLAGASDVRFHRRAALVGLVLLGVTIGLPAMPLPVAFLDWIGPLAVVMLRVGAMLVTMAMLYALFRRRRPPEGGPMMVLGRASLMVYWVHVELAYGNVSYPLHRALSLPWALTGVLLMTGAMYGLARWWLGRPPRRRWVPPHMVASGV